MVQVELAYEHGEDALAAYWGYLADGGLDLPADLGSDLAEAQDLVLRLQVGRSRADLRGRIVGRRADGRAALAFASKLDNEAFFALVLGDGREFAGRAHDRAERLQVRVRGLGSGGCRVELEVGCDELFPVGSDLDLDIDVDADTMSRSGRIVWSTPRHRYLLFA